MPIDNNEHQRIDDVSTDRISYDKKQWVSLCDA